MTTDDITALRWREPGAVAHRLAQRRPFAGIGEGEKLLLIAADHPARGALGAGSDPLAMADRGDLLDRVAQALARPGVHGFLGTADVVEELTVRGALEGKLVLGSMNRGGLQGSAFELDDRFTGYDAAGIARSGLDGGKMLLRIDPADPASVRTLESCARAVDDLSARELIAMVEPFWAVRRDGLLRNELTAEATLRAVQIASGLGSTSARTWLKLPVVPEMERVMAATTLPTLLLGGEVAADHDATLADWHRTLALPGVCGLVIGRSLLYPPHDDVAAAVDAAVALL